MLSLINDFSKISGCEINIQKSVALLYTKNELPKREIKKTIPFTIASKTIKYLGINSTKKVKDLYTKNYKILVKDIKEVTNKCKDISYSWIRKVNIVKRLI